MKKEGGGKCPCTPLGYATGPNVFHIQHHYICNICYVVITISMGNSLKYTTNCHDTQQNIVVIIFRS